MVIKNKNFLTRGEEAQREREAALKEYSREERHHFREMDEVVRQRDAALASSDYDSAAGHEGTINSLLAATPDVTKDRIETTEKMYRRGVRTALGSRATKEDIARHQYSTANYGAASSIASQPSTRLQSQIEEAQSGRYALNQDILKESRQLSDAGTSNEEKKRLQSSLSTKWQQLDTYAQQEGVAKTGIAIQKRQGTDLAGVYEKTAGILKRKENESIASDVRSGKAGSAASINEDFDKKLKELTATFDELRNVIHSTTASVEEREAAEKKHKKAAEEFDTVSIQKDTSTSMGGRGAGWSKAFSALQDVGAIAGAGGGMYRQWTVTQEMDRTRLQTGAVDIVNRRFFDNVSAAKGDATAIARIGGGQHKKSYAFAKEMGKDEVRASGAEAVGSTLQAVGVLGGAVLGAKVGAGIGAFFGGVGAVPGAVIGGALGGLGALALASGSIQKASGDAAKLQSGAVRAGQELESYNAKEAEFDAQNKMKAFVNQNALDFTKNSYAATRGVGGGRKAMLKEMRDPAFVREMAGEEMDQEGILNATAYGKKALGKSFSMQDVRRGAQLTKLGLMDSPEEYSHQLGQMASVGGKKDNLETILKNAVQSGLDSSKHINELVQGITLMSSASSRGGVSTFGGASALTMLTAETMRLGGMDPNVAGKAALDMNKDWSDASSSSGITVQNLIEDSDLHKALPGMDTTTSARMRIMKPEEYRTLSEAKTDEEFKAAKINLGIDAKYTKEQLATANDAAGKQALSSLLGVGINGKMEDALERRRKKEVMKSDDPSEDEMKTYFNARAHTAGFTPIAATTSLDVLSDMTSWTKSATQGKLPTVGKGTANMTDWIKRNEGFRDKMYNDNGRPAIGYGHNIVPGEPMEQLLKVGKITPEMGERILQNDISKHQTFLGKLNKTARAGLSQNQITALTDAEFNQGGNAGGFNKILDAINAGKSPDEVGKLFSGLKHKVKDKDGNLVDHSGLIKRFDEDAALYQTPDTDQGSQQFQDAATSGAVAYAAGLEDLTKNIKIMSEAAVKIDPKNFQEAIEASSETLGTTLGHLNDAIGRLNKAVGAAADKVIDIKAHANEEQAK